MWRTDPHLPPTGGFRSLAMTMDVEALSPPGTVLFLLPGWSQYPEAHAMVAVANAMHRDIMDIPESMFREAS